LVQSPTSVKNQRPESAKEKRVTAVFLSENREFSIGQNLPTPRAQRAQLSTTRQNADQSVPMVCDYTTEPQQIGA
jgi:hypothetical protein